MFAQKFRRTFTAMFRGWVVCNLITLFAFAVWIILRLFSQDRVTSSDLFNSCFYLILYTLMAMLYSGIAVLAVWLFVLLPLDLMIRESSLLRNPVPATILGAFGGFFSIMAFWAALNFAAPDSGANLPWVAAFGALAAITGLTAARHLVRNHPQQLRASQ